MNYSPEVSRKENIKFYTGLIKKYEIYTKWYKEAIKSPKYSVLQKEGFEMLLDLSTKELVDCRRKLVYLIKRKI